MSKLNILDLNDGLLLDLHDLLALLLVQSPHLLQLAVQFLALLPVLAECQLLVGQLVRQLAQLRVELLHLTGVLECKG